MTSIRKISETICKRTINRERSSYFDDHANPTSTIGARTDMKCMTLKTFITLYEDDLEQYYGEDFGSVNGSARWIDFDQHGDTVILCLVDTRESGNGFSTDKRPRLRRAGAERKRKIKHRYSYINPLNRIHGFVIASDGNNNLTPSEKNIISLSLVCSSPFSGKRGVGSDLMDILMAYSLFAGYTDMILEVANDFSEMGCKEEESEEDSDSDSDSDSEEEEDDDHWTPSEEVLDILAHELWRKTMRKEGDRGSTPYYNIDEEYIREHLENYFFNIENADEEVEPIVVSEVDDPMDHEYGGYWFNQGYKHQYRLSQFYKKFGFYDEPKVHLDWQCYGNVPYPTMIRGL